MKKLLSMILAVAMMFALAVTVFAENSATLDANENNSKDMPVTITVTSDLTKVYSVKVDWNLTFTYAFGAWSPDFQNPGYNGNGWGNQTGSIKITNASNDAVTYSLGDFSASNGYEAVTMVYSEASATIESADDNDGTGTVHEKTVTVTPGGKPTSLTAVNSAQMGTVKVTISPANNN